MTLEDNGSFPSRKLFNPEKKDSSTLPSVITEELIIQEGFGPVELQWEDELQVKKAEESIE